MNRLETQRFSPAVPTGRDKAMNIECGREEEQGGAVGAGLVFG